MKKNVLIFTASTGQGHNAAAESLEKELTFQGYEVFTIEPTREVSKSLNTFIADGYKVLATRLPKMYGTLYKLSNYRKTNNQIAKLLKKALEEKIYNLICSYDATLVISTHPLIVNVISTLKERGKVDVPFISVVTDYQAHQSYIHQYVDAYIAGSEHTKNSLIKKGISEDKIYTYGIPIRREFHNKIRLYEKEHYFTVLIMGGSMGVNGIKKALKNLLEVQYPIKITVVCGNNKALKKTLLNKYINYDGDKKIEILGYSNNIPDIMDEIDVIITKPGGVTVTEALVKEIPMIIPYYLPGQEKENTQILNKAGAAKSASVKELKNIIEEFIKNPEQLQQMKDNIKEIIKTHSLDSTVHLAISLIEEYEHDSENDFEYGR